MSASSLLLERSPYQQYLYGYPHKTAYRAFARAMPLETVWSTQNKAALFLYVHIPFCEMRCGFCNLFTAANPVEKIVEDYVTALEHEARAVRSAVGAAGYARAAIGGGTPTFLDAAQLSRVFDVLERVMGAKLGSIPMSVEVSPETVNAEKVDVLFSRGATRVSIGVQSFVPGEVAAVKRPQRNEDVARALDAIRAKPFETLNIDLIYGIDGQTEATFIESIDAARRWRPEEIYLYPLYVRPLTFLGKSTERTGHWDQHRLNLYRAGREHLLSNGYEQVSMRMFRLKAATSAPSPIYRCQEDGMVGLGCGARSYAGPIHYSQEWAVASRAVRGIIDEYNARPIDSFHFAHHGFELSAAEQRRRYAILSVLADGLEFRRWHELYGLDAFADLPQLAELVALGFATRDELALKLTPAGIERSDAIGPWLHSGEVNGLMKQWESR